MNKSPHDLHFWCEKEEEYLQLLHKTCLELVTVYRELYVSASRLQKKLKLPAIIMSSLSGAASFGSSSFASWSSNPEKTQKYINVSIGLVNVFIAMVQTYETFIKVGDILSKSISTSITLKKLAEDIHCMIFIPVGDRETAGILYLRDVFNKYQSIMEQAPPLEHATKDYLFFEQISEKIKLHVSKKDPQNKRYDTRSIPSRIDEYHEFKSPVPSRNTSESMDSYGSVIVRNKKQETASKDDDTSSNVDAIV